MVTVSLFCLDTWVRRHSLVLSNSNGRGLKCPNEECPNKAKGRLLEWLFPICFVWRPPIAHPDSDSEEERNASNPTEIGESNEGNERSSARSFPFQPRARRVCSNQVSSFSPAPAGHKSHIAARVPGPMTQIRGQSAKMKSTLSLPLRFD